MRRASNTIHPGRPLYLQATPHSIPAHHLPRPSETSLVKLGMERATGFEPVTASLEGWNSTTELRPPTRNQLSSPYRLRRTATGGRNFIARFMTGYVRIRTIGSVTQLLHRAQDSLMWWAGKGSNLGSHKAADLQSAPFVHLGTCPNIKPHIQFQSLVSKTNDPSHSFPPLWMH